MKPKKIFLTVLITLIIVAGIAVPAFWPSVAKKPVEHYHRTRVLTPVAPGVSGEDSASEQRSVHEENYNLKVPLEDNEFVVSILDHYFDGDIIEDQIVAYRNPPDTEESPIFITYIGYDTHLKAYRRFWNTPTAASMPATVSLYVNDLLGDRSSCITVTGMNASGEHTMTVFRKNPSEDRETVFAKIADIRMDGSITVQETERPPAYRQGVAGGQPFNISAYGRDADSDNILDRIEINYSYNQARNFYEQSNVTRVPGSQIEQRRVREILSGDRKVFENFINDLWYHISPQGTVDRKQYLYFDPEKREIIFYGDGSQQIFKWQNSSSTRYGLHITSQNISVTTLRRLLNIELESLDSLRIKVTEDVRVKVSVETSWDGSYRRASSVARSSSAGDASSFIDAAYDGVTGRITFFPNGEYEFGSSSPPAKGRYVFFRAGGNDLLEIRPEQNSPPPLERQGAKNENGETRLIYRVTPAGDNITLLRVRLGVTGIQELHETQITLTKTVSN